MRQMDLAVAVGTVIIRVIEMAVRLSLIEYIEIANASIPFEKPMLLIQYQPRMFRRSHADRLKRCHSVSFPDTSWNDFHHSI